MRASAGTSSGWANARSIVSLARNILRLRSSVAKDTRDSLRRRAPSWTRGRGDSVGRVRPLSLG
jgi:hypothetical protein